MASSGSSSSDCSVSSDSLPSEDECLPTIKQEVLTPQVPPTSKFKPARNSLKKKDRSVTKERSKIWVHFEKQDVTLMDTVDGVLKQVGTQKRAICKYCKTPLKCDSRASGISSLHKHINKHCKQYPGRVDVEVQKTISYDVNDPAKNMIAKVWSEEACVDAACAMIVLDELPFSFIERPGFLQFCKVAVPRWIPPCRKIIVKNILRMYDAKKVELKEQLKSHSVCLTTDTWTSCQNINYMVITAHFIDGSWNMHKRILSFCVVPNHSGNSIGKILENCLNDWKLDNVLTISVDNAAANKVAIQYLVEKLKGRPKPPMFEGKFMHVRCLAHTLNLIVRSGLHLMNKSIASIRNAIRYVRSSPQRLETFKACIDTEQIQCKKICILDVPTRWNSTYLMLETALQLKKAFDRLAEEEDGRYKSYFEEAENLGEGDEDAESSIHASNLNKRVGPPSASDWEKASIFVKYLKVFLDSTLDISAQLTPTAHKAFINIVTIKAEVDDIWTKPLTRESSETEKVLHSMSNKMKVKFDKYFANISDMHPLFYIALILDPRRKLKYVQHVYLSLLSMDYEEAKKKCNELSSALVELCDLYAANSDCAQTSALKRKRDVGDGVDHSVHTSQVSSGKGKKAAMFESWNKQLESETLVVGGEVDRYLLDPIENPKDNENWDILGWWKCNGSKYPNLQTIAKDVLALQVSTVASESSFSTGKRVIDPHRSSLSPKTVEAIICLQSWLKSDAVMGLDYTPTIEEMTWFENIEREQLDEEKLKQEKDAKSTEEAKVANVQDKKKRSSHQGRKKSTK